MFTIRVPRPLARWGERSPACIDSPPEVHVDSGAEILDGDSFQGRHLDDARCVHEDVDPAEVAYCLLDHGEGLLLDGDIRRDDVRLDALPLEGLPRVVQL